MVIVFWKRCFPSLRFSTRTALAQCGLFFLSEAVQSLMSPLKWGPCLNTVSFPLPCWWRIPSKTVDSQGGLVEDCIVIPPVQGPLLTAVLPPGTSTRPLTFYPHFLLHLPEFLIFLCSGYCLGLQDVLWCALLLSSLYSFSSRCTEASKAKFASLWSVALLVHLRVGVTHPLSVDLVLASNAPALLCHPSWQRHHLPAPSQCGTRSAFSQWEEQTLSQRTLQRDGVQNSPENRSCLNPALYDLPSHSLHSAQSWPPWWWAVLRHREGKCVVSTCFYKQATLERALPQQMLLVSVLRKQ